AISCGHASDARGNPSRATSSLEQRVTGQAVGPMQARRGSLAAGPHSLNRGPPFFIHGDAAHVIVRRRPYPDPRGGRIDAGRVAVRPDDRKARGKVLTERIARIEKHAMPP